jgi:Fe-S-cluster containining protein
MDAGDIKPRHDWCQHAKPGHGCGIYKERPEICREFHCQWIIDTRHPDYWFPAKSKIIINALIEHGAKYISFIVDPAYPLRWREEPYFSDIKHIAKAGVDGRFGEKWTTIVMIKDERIPIIGTARLIKASPAIG